MSMRTQGPAPDPLPDPTPDVADLLQRDEPDPAVRVHQDGPVEIHRLPSRSAPAFSLDLTGRLEPVVHGPDWRRARVVLIGDAGWLYSHSASGPGVPWPAAVPLVIEHCDAVYAAWQTDPGSETVTLSVITEMWSD